MHPNEHCNCRYADVGCDRMEQVMDQISGKWKMRILFMVGAHGTLRYGELRKLLDGVTHKMLSNQLKELAADGLVQRIDYNEVPPRVEYSLAEAQAICADPAACADELASAGVETDFPGMELGGVPDKLTALDAVLGAQGQPVK